MRYQFPEQPAGTGSSHGAFRDAVRTAAQVALQLPTLTTADRQLCHDIRRSEGRYQFRALDRLLDLLALVPDDRLALEFCDNLRAAIVARRRRFAPSAPSINAALVAETVAEAASNPLQLRVAMEGARDVRVVSAAIVAGERHASALDTLLNSLRVARVALLHGGAR